MIYGIFGLILVSAISYLVFYLRHDNQDLGKAEEANKAMSDMMEEARVVKAARDVIAADPNGRIAQRLRDKYLRKP